MPTRRFPARSDKNRSKVQSQGVVVEPTQMRVQSIRFGEKVWERIQRAAQDEGVSASQYVREAALIRAFLQERARGEPVAAAFEEIAAEVSKLSRPPS